MSSSQEIRDAALNGAAKTALGLDPDVDINEVSVDTADGVVRLQGVVRNLETKERAERTISILPGVKGVDNALAVEARDNIHDDDISRMVEEAWAADPSLDAADMEARVVDSVVHLMGRVDNPNQVGRAIEIATSVKGVKEVINELHTERAGPTDDVTIHNDVVEVLSQAEDINPIFITVSVEDGVVTLSGEAESEKDLHRAEDLAGSVPGVRRVINAIVLSRNLY